MKHNYRHHLFVLLGLACVAFQVQPLNGQIITPDPQNMNLTGTTSYDGWNNLTASHYPGYPSFPGTGNWPHAIVSNTAGSGNATFNKTANGNGGGAEPAGESIYNGGFSADPNIKGATFSVSDTTPLANLQTVVFQLDIGEAFGYDLWNGAEPTLTYNTSAGSFTEAATFSATLVKYDTGQSVDMPIGPGGANEPVEIYQNLHAYQFDLSGATDPITSFNVSYTAVQHSQIYAMQLDQSDSFYSQAAFNTQAVPEPSTYAMMLVGVGLLVWRLRRQRQHAIFGF